MVGQLLSDRKLVGEAGSDPAPQEDRRRAVRAGREDDSDLLGVLAIAALLVLLPLVTDGASSLAGLGGGLAGIVLGLGLARAR